MAARRRNAEEVGLPRFEVPLPPHPGEGADVFDLSSHGRAREALGFGLAIEDGGYNVFVVGAPSSGRLTRTVSYLEAAATRMAAPSDWLYLANFQHPNRPRPVALPAGVGRRFARDLEQLVSRLRDGLREVFTSEAYQKDVGERQAAMRREVSEKLDALGEQARAAGLRLLQTQSGGIAVGPGPELQEQGVEKLGEEERGRIEKAGQEIGEKLAEINRLGARRDADFRNWLREQERMVGESTISGPISQMIADYGAYPGLNRWLTAMKVDMVDHLRLFVAPGAEAQKSPAEEPERRYACNLLVDYPEGASAPVVIEPNPTYENLVGRIEYMQAQGMLYTDFTMIRPGALHRANGGVLVLRAEALASTPMAWPALKAALRDRHIQVEELYRAGGVPIAGAPRPKPVPLTVKVVVVGSPFWFYTFFSADPEFSRLFKVKAEVDVDLDATPENLATYAALVCGAASGRKARVSKEALAELMGLASRWAGDRTRLSAQFERLDDVVSEALVVARSNGGKSEIGVEELRQALGARRRRNALVEQRVQDQIARGVVHIDTAGRVVGQVNALTVRDTGDHTFGAPARVTARISMGRQGLVNIEREVALGGPVQQKGALVMQGYLAGRFARSIPLSFNCSITFEQSYGGVEGDSASLAELIAIISDLAGVPIRQELAVTGSVSQRGYAQAVGGIHHKVEGFFQTCERAGLTGEQGVVLPESNARHLVLEGQVAEAVAAGRFHVWTVDSVEDAIELLMEMPAGRAGEDGRFPPETVFGRAAAALERFDAILTAREGGSTTVVE